MATGVRARVFWSGGSQAVRLPKDVRLPGDEVIVHRRGKNLTLEPVPEGDDWVGFWDRLLPLKHRVRRWPAGRTERRKPL